MTQKRTTKPVSTNSGTAPASAGVSSSILLTELMGETEQAISRIDTRATAGLDIETEIDNLQKKLDANAAVADDRERKMRERVLTANLERIRSEAATEERDLAQAVFGLNTILEQVGREYAQLGELNADEKQIIASAETLVAEAEAALERAKTKWFFRGSAIAEAEAALQTAEAGVEEATAEARRRARQRLLSADMESSLAEFQVRVEKTIRIMEARREAIARQIKVVSARKDEAYKIKEQSARALETLDGELNAKEADLKTEEEKLLGLVNGTTEYAAQDKVISDLRAEVEELRGKRNAALALHQSKEKFCEELDIHVSTQQKLHDNMRTWIVSLRSDTEERVVTFKSRLEAQKAAADQDVAQQLDKLGAAIDRNNADFMAAVGAASDRLRMQKLEAHPERLRELHEIAAARAEATAEIRGRENALIEDFKRRFGIDPTESSFFHYQDKGGAVGGESAGTSF